MTPVYLAEGHRARWACRVDAPVRTVSGTKKCSKRAPTHAAVEVVNMEAWPDPSTYLGLAIVSDMLSSITADAML